MLAIKQTYSIPLARQNAFSKLYRRLMLKSTARFLHQQVSWLTKKILKTLATTRHAILNHETAQSSPQKIFGLHSKQWRSTHFKPSPRKCWPIKRTESSSNFVKVFCFAWLDGILCFEAESNSPFELASHSSTSTSPKCVRLLCISDAKLTVFRAFLRGGGDGPPSSCSSSDEARVAQQNPRSQIRGIDKNIFSFSLSTDLRLEHKQQR